LRLSKKKKLYRCTVHTAGNNSYAEFLFSKYLVRILPY